MTTAAEEDFVGLADDLDGVIPDDFVDNTYLCELTDIDITKGNDGRRWLVIKWEVVEDGDYYGEELGPEIYWMFNKNEYEKADPDDRKKMKQARRKRIARLESLGVPRDKFAEFDMQQLQGIKAYLTVQVRPRSDKPGNNVWINKVELADSALDSNPLAI